MNKILARNSPYRHLVAGGLLGALLLLGLVIWRDFGMSFDLGQSRNIGMTSLHYVAEKVAPDFLQNPVQKRAFAPYQEPLPWFWDRDYGVAYELPVTLGERLLKLPNERVIFFYRHLCTFIVCWIGVLALYGLGKRRYGDWRLGLAAATLLVCSPRLFGEMFYNDKDAVFMALSTVATYTAVRFLERPTWRWAIAHALACAIAIDVRLMAVLWPAVTLAMLAWRTAWGDYRPAGVIRTQGPAVLYAALLPLFIVALWPYLWQDPWHNFAQAFNNMKHFRWPGQVLYRGEMVNATDLPWHYIFKWIGITTPLLQLGLLGLGLAAVGRQAVRQRWRLYAAGTRQWQDLLFAAVSVGPIVAVISFHSVLYDGWRQLYFVYPGLLLLALRGMVETYRWLRARRGWWWPAATILGLGLLTSVVQMIWLHPYESLYFNVLAGPNFVHRYEQDYWGLAYGEGLRWIDAHDSRPVVRVCTDPMLGSPMQVNYVTLPDAAQAHIQLVSDAAQADYYLGNYRWHPQDYDMPHKSATDIMAGNQRIMTIFTLK